ncbi:ABC transporter permease [Curvivirga sp.]|uniref:ABC transporter permease n=1 Tax=Curvivirga sp. TaxID=2856848 RepID=UPI003B5C67A1
MRFLKDLFSPDYFPTFPVLVLGLFLIPVVAGILGSLLPALGYFPALGSHSFSLDVWERFWSYPAVNGAVFRSFFIGIIATFLAFAFCQLICACFYQTKIFDRILRGLSPILSIPHVSLSLGLVFLLAPSGWILRLLSPEFTGFDRPVPVSFFPDVYGGSLIVALLVKEIPFLLIMTLGAMNEIPVNRGLRVMRGLGYGRLMGWSKAILPQIYGRMRLPVLAVLVFSVSVVDMAIILLPSNSPNLGILVLRWFNDGDLSFQYLAAMGAMIQMVIAFTAVLVWIMLEQLGKFWLSKSVMHGQRYVFSSRLVEGGVAKIMRGFSGLVFLLGAFSVVILFVWSFAGRWKYPDALPSLWTIKYWSRHLDGVGDALWHTICLGLFSTLLSLILVIGCLETQQDQRKRFVYAMQMLIYIPLLVPQLAFLFGVQLFTLTLHLDGVYIGVVWSHLLFVLPYMYLSLQGPYSNLDSRYIHTAKVLGQDRLRILFKIKLPMLLRPILIAFAIGFAVSIAQYLTTLFMGAGRIETLTTEAVALSSGSDRRVIGIYAFVQAILPFIIFGIATILPKWIFANRLGMLGER